MQYPPRRQVGAEAAGDLSSDLLSSKLDHQLAMPGAYVEVDQHDLLPHTERQLAVLDRDRKRGADQRRAEMAVGVGVARGEVVQVGRILGRQLLQEFLEVRDQAWLVLDRRDTGRRPRDEDRGQTVPNTG